MSDLPSNRMYDERPPSADEAFARLLNRSKAVGGTMAQPSDATSWQVGMTGSPTGQPPPQVLLRHVPRDFADVAGVPEAEAPASKQMTFDEIFSSPENQVFKVVFFPDRIFHAQYLNASRVPHRYRYAVHDTRSILDVTVLKASVYMDGRKAASLLRIEYRATRLIEQSRESGRFMREHLIAWLKVTGLAPKLNQDGEPVHDAQGDIVLEKQSADQPVKLQYCPWIDAYQVEIWSTLEPPAPENHHDFQVTAQMGPTSPITRVRKFAPFLERLDDLTEVELAFRENDVHQPYGTPIVKPNWDNNYERSFQVPNSPRPNDHAVNTVPVNNYYVSFQKGWFLNSAQIRPVRYRNAMMDGDNPDFVGDVPGNPWHNPDAWQWEVPAEAYPAANVIEMRWILQREFGGSVVFFHEVTIPPGTVEGTHKHVGSEELYYIVSGRGVAYMAAGDDPATDHFHKVTRRIYGLFDSECVELPVGPGNVIFTKSGGVHGIKNTGTEPLKFVAFLYHSV